MLQRIHVYVYHSHQRSHLLQIIYPLNVGSSHTKEQLPSIQLCNNLLYNIIDMVVFPSLMVETQLLRDISVE